MLCLLRDTLIIHHKRQISVLVTSLYKVLWSQVFIIVTVTQSGSSMSLVLVYDKYCKYGDYEELQVGQGSCLFERISCLPRYHPIM